MPDRRQHRGLHPRDETLFAARAIPPLREAVRDLSWLLSRGYSVKAAVKLVGDRYQLAERQRTAAERCACSDEDLRGRRSREAPPAACAGQSVAVDGHNILITLETALSGGVVLRGRDGALRDLSGLHGTYRSVVETRPAIELMGRALLALGVSDVTVYLDAPVSNSGRLRSLLRQTAESRGWPWRVELENDPDRILIETSAVVASSDSRILSRCRRWTNLTSFVLDCGSVSPRLVDLA